MAEALTLSVPTETQKNSQLDFQVGENLHLAAVACTAWASSTDPQIRVKFGSQIQEAIEHLIRLDPSEQHSGMTGLVDRETSRWSSFDDLPQGLLGYSLAIANDGLTPNTAKPHVRFANYSGQTGIFVPTLHKVHRRTYTGHYMAARYGLYILPTERAELGYGIADTHTLLLEDPAGSKIYIGSRSAVQTIQEDSATATTVGHFASIELH